MFPSAKELSKLNDKILARQNTTNTLLAIIAKALVVQMKDTAEKTELFESISDTIKVIKAQVRE